MALQITLINASAVEVIALIAAIRAELIAPSWPVVRGAISIPWLPPGSWYTVWPGSWYTRRCWTLHRLAGVIGVVVSGVAQRDRPRNPDRSGRRAVAYMLGYHIQIKRPGYIMAGYVMALHAALAPATWPA
jgi:hypothetical protein